MALISGLALAKQRGLEARAVSDHGSVQSIYLRDPNGYVIELAVKQPGHDQAMDPATNGARAKLDAWQSAKLRERAVRRASPHDP